jgi:hypothetical protein
MLYREIIAVCSQIHTKHINTLRGPMWTYQCKSRWYIPLPMCLTGKDQYRSLHMAAATLPQPTHTCRFIERLPGHSNALRGHRNLSANSQSLICEQ